MGLVSESRRRARGGRTAAVTLSYLKAALRGLGSQEETTAGPKQALEIHQQHNGCMWLEFITLRWSEVVSLQGCSSGCLRLVEYPRGCQSTHVKVVPPKSFTSFLEGSGWRLHVVLCAPRAGRGCTLSPHVTQQLSETEAVSVVTRRQPWQVCRWPTAMSRRFLAPSLKAERRQTLEQEDGLRER